MKYHAERWIKCGVLATALGVLASQGFAAKEGMGSRARRLAQADVAVFPETPAGRSAKFFIAAFNSGDETKMREFSQSHRSKSALEGTPMKERIEQYRELRDDWGKLEVRKVESQDAQRVTVTVKPERGFSALAMSFQCEKELPHKLSEIRITPTLLAGEAWDISNERVVAGKMGNVTVLKESLKPLRDHFNANTDKHRFVAILSPT